jgi:hypothetical protein
MTVVWDVAPGRAMITLMIKAVITFETPVNFNQTLQRNILEDGHLRLIPSDVQQLL